MFSTFKKQSKKRLGTYNAKPVFVQSDLAQTPSKMLELSQHGIPVSSHIDDSSFYDGDKSSKVTLDPLHRRGVDVNDAWNLSQDSRAKLRKFAENSQSSDS